MTTPPGGPPPYEPPPPYGQAPGQQPWHPYPPPPPLPYPEPAFGHYGPPPQQKTNWWAVVSLIFGVLGGVLISVVCGIVGLTKARQGQGGRGMAIAGLVLSGLWVLLLVAGLIFYLSVGRDTVVAMDIKEGDCLKSIPGGAQVLTVQTVGCEEVHAGEVFAVLVMPDGGFPGQAAIDGYADRCSPELASYSPAAMVDDSVQLYVLYPTEDTWAQGDRAVTCIATLDPPRAGPLRG
ncbi:septum formation family protein [Mycolicibacterium sp. XJ1819]